jgi:DHA1 family tetracycline resistance protein-like MFS transporter
MAMVGVSLMVSGFATAVVQGALIKPIVSRIGEKRALFVGLVATILGQAAIGAAPLGWMVFAVLPLFALGGLAGPSVQAIVSRSVGPSEQGELQGAINSLNGLMAILGPQIGTKLLEAFAVQGAAPYVPGAPFYAASALVVVGLLLALRALAGSPAPSPASTPVEP